MSAALLRSESDEQERRIGEIRRRALGGEKAGDERELVMQTSGVGAEEPHEALLRISDVGEDAAHATAADLKISEVSERYGHCRPRSFLVVSGRGLTGELALEMEGRELPKSGSIEALRVHSPEAGNVAF